MLPAHLHGTQPRVSMVLCRLQRRFQDSYACRKDALRTSPPALSMGLAF